MEEIYVSVDIEADGPIPGDFSMLSVGSAAYNESEKLISTFSANLAPLEGAKQHPDTMDFWKDNPKAWEEVNKDQQPPDKAMAAYAAWLDGLSGSSESSLVFVAYPAVFDFSFVHWYLLHFVGRDPFGFYALDLKTYAMAALGIKFIATVKSNMPADWIDRKHNHIALDDALEQADMFFAIRKAIKGG